MFLHLCELSPPCLQPAAAAAGNVPRNQSVMQINLILTALVKDTHTHTVYIQGEQLYHPLNSSLS